ncbi:hypothetical protein TcCL_NonESM05990 [Trypanosoma cruzi]|nr:hypothetical protein TcCL_NonESM05990 [Trypanosoma cruzi]
MLSLSTGSRTLFPRHTHAIAQAAVTRSTRHIHRHNHRIRIARYISSTPNSRHTEQAPTTTATRASAPSSIHDAAPKFPAIPPSMGHGAQLNAATRGASHPQEKGLGLRTPSPFSSRPRKKTTATRNCQHALQKKHPNPLQCASCVLLLCLQQHKAKK